MFVGGSLVPAGGHNLLEPAAYGKPIVVGPHMENFAEIVDAFLANGAAIQVRSERELEQTIVSLMSDPVRRARLGAAARALVDANRGARDRTLAVIAGLLPPADAAAPVWSVRSASSIERRHLEPPRSEKHGLRAHRFEPAAERTVESAQCGLRPGRPVAALLVRAASARPAAARTSGGQRR